MKPVNIARYHHLAVKAYTVAAAYEKIAGKKYLTPKVRNIARQNGIPEHLIWDVVKFGQGQITGVIEQAINNFKAQYQNIAA